MFNFSILFFVIEFLSYYRFLPIFKNDWIFIDQGLFFVENIVYNSALFNFGNR